MTDRAIRRLRSVCFPVLLLSACLVLSGCERPAALVEFSGSTMGTTFSVKLPALPGGLRREDVAAGIDECLEDINSKMSTYLADSEVSRFNRHAGTDWFPVSEETAAVVAAALDVARQSGGAFDPTVGPLVDLWGFGPAGGRERVPGDDEIAAARALVGHEHLRVREDPPALQKTLPGLRIDLSAIAKGYAVDRVSDYLSSRGIEDHFVEVGGEIRARGEKAAGRSWRVAIESPTRGSRAALADAVFELRDRAVATSGDYRNFRPVDGRSHTIDPRTGRPVTHGLASASVFAPTCMEADAWATALVALGPSEGQDLARERNLAALFIVRGSAERDSGASPGGRPESGGSVLMQRRSPALLEIQRSGGSGEGAAILNWIVFVGALLVFFGVVAAMSVGVVFGGRRIKGSCGGLAAWRDELGRPMCDACADCPEKRLECELENGRSPKGDDGRPVAGR